MSVSSLLAKMGAGERLTSGETEELRLGIQRLEYAAGQVSALVGQSGAGLHPDVFRNSGGFSLLPQHVLVLRLLQGAVRC